MHIKLDTSVAVGGSPTTKGDTMIQLKLPIKIIPKKRPIVTKNGTFMPKPYMEQRKLIQAKLGGFTKLNGELSMDCLFIFKQSKTNHKNKMSMPVGDVDGLIGSLMDACEGVLYDNDRCIVEINSKKMWGHEDMFIMTLKEV